MDKLQAIEGTLQFGEYTITTLIEADPYMTMSPPEKECDGHGRTSEVREYIPDRLLEGGARVLYRDRNVTVLYHFAEAVKTAIRDGWGSKGDEKLRGKEKAVHAAEADFKYIRGWYQNEWQWLQFTVMVSRGALKVGDFSATGFDDHEAALDAASEAAWELVAGDRKTQEEAEARANQLHETIADIAYQAGVAGYYSGDSRQDMATFISWAEEFEKLRVPDDGDDCTFRIPPCAEYPDGYTREYMDVIERFTAMKLAEYPDLVTKVITREAVEEVLKDVAAHVRAYGTEAAMVPVVQIANKLGIAMS